MKKISLMLIAIMLLASTSVFATEEATSNDPSKELRTKVKKLLNSYFEMSSEDQFTATIVFTVNAESELVVLSVDCEEKKFCRFVKNKLNYKDVEVDGVVEGRRYSIPLIVKT